MAKGFGGRMPGMGGGMNMNMLKQAQKMHPEYRALSRKSISKNTNRLRRETHWLSLKIPNTV